MARKPDIAEMVSMLHTAVLHGDQSLRDALTESFEKVDGSGRTAQEATSRAVTDGLTRVFDEVNQLRKEVNRTLKPASGDLFTSKTEEVTGLLRAELTELRTTLNHLNHLNALTPTPPAAPGAPAAFTGPDGPITPLQPAIPAQRRSDHEDPTLGSYSVPAPTSGPGTGDGQETGSQTAPAAGAQELGDGPAGKDPATETAPETAEPTRSQESVRQAVREVFAQELAPLVEQLTTDKQRDGAVAEQLRETVREAVHQVREELVTALEEARAGLTALTQELAELRTVVDQLQAGTDETSEPVPVAKEHTALLRSAARISSADLYCHRDTWEFITARTAGHPHFRVPPRVTEEPGEGIFAPLSGRSLIALLISLHAITSAPSDNSGDHELAATVYDRINQRLTRLSLGEGERVTITLDDRVTPDQTTDGDDQAGESGRQNGWGA
ncbi:hypothetical protein A6A28_31075 [Streptomyces sp. CB03578]|uniref:hypothetical protein n=1 Tax=Streptomyces sp. CB03578 TaxID=1718987 RepID=UPI00093E0B69|nr:hypothetical protein [Streptomyces sp. CB03578]OKI38050.1 hypothetical protein A6A28_31075 [Streptomyces sp. CB03578]